MRGFVVAILLGLSVVPASAGAVESPGYLLATQSRLSLAQAAEKLRDQVGGRVLDARAAEDGGRTVYLIKILVRPGKVRVYRVDPYSGEIL